MSRPFIPVVTTTEDHEKAAKLVEHAETYVMSHREMRRIMSGLAPAAGDDPARCMVLGGSLRCVLSHEQQPCGLCRHLSMSLVEAFGNDPIPVEMATHMAVHFFGFEAQPDGAVDLLASYMELGGKTPSINFIQKIHDRE